MYIYIYIYICIYYNDVYSFWWLLYFPYFPVFSICFGRLDIFRFYDSGWNHAQKMRRPKFLQLRSAHNKIIIPDLYGVNFGHVLKACSCWKSLSVIYFFMCFCILYKKWLYTKWLSTWSGIWKIDGGGDPDFPHRFSIFRFMLEAISCVKSLFSYKMKQHILKWLYTKWRSTWTCV